MTSKDVPTEFLGFARPKGRAGTRNTLLVLGINGLVTRAAERISAALPGSRLVATPYGRGQLGRDKDMHTAQLIGLGAHPNVGAVLIVAADRPTAETIANSIADRSARPVEIVSLDDVEEDALALTATGIRRGGALARLISGQPRTPLPVAELFLGIECGHSDATSGLFSNPLSGAAADRLVERGGTVVIGETLEWLGAEHVLAKRAADAAIGRAVVAAVESRERAVSALGVDLLYNNPGYENVRGGLSTIEEKSLGAIAKAGSTPIRSVLDFAQPPETNGLHVMDGPGFSPESMTGFAAAGAQIMMFTTGAGNSFCSLLAPTIKISAHPHARLRTEQIDFDASALWRGEATLPDMAEGLLSRIIDVASGLSTWGEVYGEGNEAFARFGSSF